MSIFLNGNSHEVEYTIQQKNSGTGALEAAHGLTLHCAICAAPDTTTPIGADEQGAGGLKLDLTERSSKNGTYFGIFDGGDLQAALATYVEKTVYEVVYDDASEIHAAHAQRVLIRTV